VAGEGKVSTHSYHRVVLNDDRTNRGVPLCPALIRFFDSQPHESLVVCGHGYASLAL